MPNQTQNLAFQSLQWLREKVFPLWLRVGIDHNTGIFVENLSFDGIPQNSSRRSLVQARQIYAFCEGVRLGVIDKSLMRDLIDKSGRSFVGSYALPNGAFVHSVGTDNQHQNLDLDLYSQAFAIFGLAQAYMVSPKEEFKTAALKTVKYLYEARKNRAGGFTEIKSSKTSFQSNPHMHLFESAIAWLAIDKNPTWAKLSAELYDLCTKKFVDSKTGFLAEFFDENWNPIRENGNFVFEPGHHFEWSWLITQYRELVPGENLHSRKLFDLAEKFGLSSDKRLALDEIWSNGEVKKKSSRFWPQCERVKAAVVLGEAKIADQAMKALLDNFLILDKGLWKDTLLEDGKYAEVPVKASSLYHIINAISEYLKHQPKFGA